jgi:formate dehydrogenase iron-sulfur subunit
MEKCTGCLDRVGAQMEPACASLCPTDALQFGKWDEISRLGSPTTVNFNDPALTKPRIRFINDPYPEAAK